MDGQHNIKYFLEPEVSKKLKMGDENEQQGLWQLI